MPTFVPLTSFGAVILGPPVSLAHQLLKARCAGHSTNKVWVLRLVVERS